MQQAAELTHLWILILYPSLARSRVRAKTRKSGERKEKRTRHKETNVIGLHLYEVPRVPQASRSQVKLLECRIMVVRGYGRGEWEVIVSCIQFQCGMMKKFWRWMLIVA